MGIDFNLFLEDKNESKSKSETDNTNFNDLANDDSSNDVHDNNNFDYDHDVNYNDYSNNNNQSEKVSSNDKKENFQKFLLYMKLRELQYTLDNYELIYKFKNKREMIKFIDLLRHTLSFFDLFDYKESVEIANNLIEIYKKITRGDDL